MANLTEEIQADRIKELERESKSYQGMWHRAMDHVDRFDKQRTKLKEMMAWAEKEARESADYIDLDCRDITKLAIRARMNRVAVHLKKTLEDLEE